MTSHESFDDDERALARALHGRVDHMNDSPLDPQDVHDRARGIRRSRAAIAGAGIAAALAIIVPTALFAGGAFDSERPPVTSQSASPSPSPTEVTDPTASVSPTDSTTPVLDVADLATGAAPGLAWIDMAFKDGIAAGGTLHTMEGADLELPALTPVEFARVGDRFAVLMYDVAQDVEQVYLVDAQTGSYGDPVRASGGLATSAGGQVVAWAGTDGTVHVVHADADDLTMPKVPGPGPFDAVGVVGEDCLEGRTTDAGCSILVNTTGSRARVYLTTSHGIVERLPYLQATTSFEDVLGGLTSIDENEPGSCSDLATIGGDKLWSTCDNTLGVFAPDGRHLVGLPGYLDGFGPNSLDLLDAGTGEPVRSWTWHPAGQGATYFSEVWEDESHLLAVTYQDQEWAVVRFGLDGSMEYAVAPVPDRHDMQSAILLQSR